MTLKINPGVVPDPNEKTYEYTCRGKVLTVALNVNVARPTIHSFLLADNLAVQPGETLVDIGSGTGFIGIAGAVAYGAKSCVCTDINADAVDVINESIRLNKLDGKVTAVQSDLFDALHGRTFDVITSNPPHSPIPPDMDQSEQMRSLGQYLSTFSGPDGLGHVRRIVKEAPTYLTPGGRLQLVLHQFLGLEKVLKLIRDAGYEAEVTATDQATMSPTTQKLRPYIEQELGYQFPTTADGTAYTLISVITARPN